MSGRGVGVGVGGGQQPVARPVRDAALTAAGREVEKPLEQVGWIVMFYVCVLLKK